MHFEIRRNRTAQGPVKLSRERAEYSRLVQQGYSNKEACRLVGIDERTGRKWRNGRSAGSRQKAAPPIDTVVPPSGPSRYLREGDRIHIADRLREKATVRAIAAELGRSPSTISREIRRNRHPANGQYRPHAAQARADARRPRPKPGKIGQNPELRDFIQSRRRLRWSPEQICQALRAQFPQRPEMHVVHETVYQALYVQGRSELRRELARALRGGPRRAVRGRRRGGGVRGRRAGRGPADARGVGRARAGGRPVRTASGGARAARLRARARAHAGRRVSLLPAAGLRVLDLTRVLAGPIATRTLALLGADVLRVDPPQLPELPDQHADTGFGKRLATLDLAADRGIFEDLLTKADVVVTGYRPGALDRFGLSAQALAERRPGIVVAQVSAWGVYGPWGDRRGFDSLVQVASGIAATEGSEEQPGALPAQALDHGTGYLLAGAVLRALTEQSHEGGSRFVRLALARTAQWLVHGSGAGAGAAGDEAYDGPGPWLAGTDSALGRLRYTLPPVSFAGGPVDWARPPVPWGTDRARWL